MKKVLTVCMGNICRSPTAEAILRHQAQLRGIALEIDSAGTIGYHAGNPPDSRARAAGERRGYRFDGISARQIGLDDFSRFDLILVADNQNLEDVLALCPAEHQYKVKRYLDYGRLGIDEIPDPYYGGAHGFEVVLDLIEEATEHLLDELSK